MSQTTQSKHRQYVIGTAGHIDHGKTALVKALTGVDTDKLPEEKQRGITIDIGFAHLSENITIIDVPGHERLIKNMVAGVSTIDLVLFVIAADDGVMPQSREHLDIINLLQIEQGIIVISKTDLVDDDWLMLVEEDVKALVKDTPLATAPLLYTSASSGKGIDELQEKLLTTLSTIPPRQDFEVFRQPVDRVFSVKGFGTVITGTVLSGKITVGDEIEIQPDGLKTRVRGLQSHDQDVNEVRTGYRTAANLAGIDMSNIERGKVLVQPDVYQPVEIINARLSLLKSAPAPLKTNQRIRFHIHTTEAFARVIIPEKPQLFAGESAFVQLRLETPIHAAYQDRFIIRQYSPQRTLGGGVVLQTNPFRFRKRYQSLFKEMLQRLEADTPEMRLSGLFDLLRATPRKLWDLKAGSNLPLSELQKVAKGMAADDQLFAANISGKTAYFSRGQLKIVLENILPLLEAYHSQYPGRPGMSEGEVVSQLEKRFHSEAIRKAIQFGVKLKQLQKEKQQVRLASFTPQLSARDSEVYSELEKRYRDAGFTPPTIKESIAAFSLSTKEFKELSRLLREEGKLIYVEETLLFHSSALEKLTVLLKDYFRKEGEISVAIFKELTGTTRKHSIPLLVYLDSNGITERHGDVRKPGYKLKGH